MTLKHRKKNKPIKVLCIDDAQTNAVNWWRMFLPMGHLARNWPEEVQVTFSTANHNPPDYYGYHVVMLLRVTEAGAAMVIENAKAAGCAVVIDNDDLIFNTPSWHPHFADYQGKRDGIEKLYLQADQIWFSTQALAAYNANLPAWVGVHVIPNAVTKKQLTMAQAPEAVGYTGNSTRHVFCRASTWQNGDYFAAAETYHKWRDWAEQWTFMGWCPPYDHAQDKTTVMSWTKPHNYLARVRAKRPGYVWKPMLDNEFNRCKTPIAWLEGLCFGAVCVTSGATWPGWELAAPDFETAEKNHKQLYVDGIKHAMAHYLLHNVNQQRLEALRKLF